MSQNAAAIPNDLKLRNRETILKAFLSGAKHTINDVAEATSISKQTVQKGIQYFLKRGLLETAGKGTSGNTGGKRPERFILSASPRFVCISMWPQYIDIVLLNMHGDILYRSEKISPLPLAFESEVAAVRKGIEDMYANSHCHRDAIQGASFSVAGVVDQRNNLFRYTSPSPPDWGTDIDFNQYFQDLFSPKTILLVENVAKMTGRSVLSYPSMLEKNVFVLFTSWGFPGCFLRNGVIYNGPGSLSGETGHMIVDPSDPEVCRCGSRGCFERQLCNKRVQRMIADGLKRYPASSLALAIGEESALPWESTHEAYMTTVFEHSQQGDKLACEISEYAARICAVLLRNISVVFEQEVVVFLGPYGRADDVFRSTLQMELLNFRFYGGKIPFEILYDHRPASELDTQGSFYGLREKYFSQDALYSE